MMNDIFKRRWNLSWSGLEWLIFQFHKEDLDISETTDGLIKYLLHKQQKFQKLGQSMFVGNLLRVFQLKY
jgi:hypothetical protein